MAQKASLRFKNCTLSSILAWFSATLLWINRLYLQKQYHRPEFDPACRIILYCAAGGRSALAADVRQTMGYSNIAHLDGGIKAWKRAAQPLSNG